MKTVQAAGAAMVMALILAGCGGGNADAAEAGRTSSSEVGSELTAWQMENGIGPITETVELGAPDEALVARGAEVFRSKCSACHKLDQRYVGPPLGTVLQRRTPTYAMNMMLNPAEMIQKHPEARALLATFMTPMPNQNLTEEDARAMVEYLRARGEQSDTSEAK